MFEVLDFFFLNQQKQQQWPTAHRISTLRGSLGSPRSTPRSCMLTTSPTLVVLGRPSPSPCSLRSPFSPSLLLCLSDSCRHGRPELQLLRCSTSAARLL